MFSSSPGFSMNVHLSPASHVKHCSNSPYITISPTNGFLATVPSTHSDFIHSTASSNCSTENNFSWCSDSGPGFQDFCCDSLLENGQIQGSGNGGSNLVMYDDLGKRNWQEWADQLITDNDLLNPNGNELLIDSNPADQEAKWRFPSFSCWTTKQLAKSSSNLSAQLMQSHQQVSIIS